MRAGEELSEMREYGRYYGRTPPPGGTGRYAYAAAAAAEPDDRSTAGGPSGRAGLYYSPPGTSYTIVERPSSHHTSRIDNYSSYNSKGPPPRGTYLGSNSSFGGGGGVGGRTTPSNNKKRPISPEQVLRMFGNNQINSSGGGKVPSERPRRSPASSPASTTHQGNYPRNQQPYIPSVHELSTRTVTMTRDPPDGTHGFGICVKGGKDSGVGVYISRVEDGSVAERAGLRPGDSILEVNGTPFTGISHEEALKMLKSCRKISMTVRSPTLPGGGSLGGPYPLRQTCSWMDRQGRPVSPPLEYATTGARTVYAPPPPQTRYGYSGSRSGSKDRSIRRVDLCIEPGQSLGLMIRGGIEYNLGIFITGVDKDSVADRAGLMIGDQILEVNGQSFLDVTHDEAVSQLKYHKRMSLLVRDVGKVPHSCTAYDRESWDISTQGRWTAALQMVEEKARVVLARSEFTSFCYYMDEYTARHMTIEAFVQVILEMLNTPEKFTLVTELREIIALEDRARFDELVYRRESDPLRARDPRDIDYRHSRRKAGMPIPENNHPLLMSSLHESIASDMICEGGAYIDEEYRSPSEDSGLGLGIADRSQRIVGRPGSANSNSGWVSGTGNNGAPVGNKATSDLALSNDEETNANQDYGVMLDDDLELSGVRDRRLSLSEPEPDDQSRTCSIDEQDYGATGYLGGLRSQLGGWTQRMKSWYWGRPLELAHKLSRSFDMKDEQSMLEGEGAGGPGMRRHQSMQRLARDSPNSQDRETAPNVVPDMQGNLRVIVKKSKPILGIAIEGGANTKHPLPRIINIHENGAAYSSGGLEVGQLILQVDGQPVEGLQHQEVARMIAESFARRDRNDIEFLVIEAKKSNLEPKPTALIFLEA